VVERTAKVEQGITEQDSPAPHVRLGFEAKAENVFRSLGLDLSENGEWITISPPSGLAIERVQVFVCPSDLGAATRSPDFFRYHDRRLAWERVEC
jgi:hypothetical protein